MGSTVPKLWVASSRDCRPAPVPVSTHSSSTAASDAMTEVTMQRRLRCRAPNTASKIATKLRDQFSSDCAPISQSAISSLRSALSNASPPAVSANSPADRPSAVV